jgi:8-oxo-dGTP pyrophosphatase MutT (NUDIX family)
MISREKLAKHIEFHLPGESAHIELAPTNRPLSSFARKNSSTYKESAVAVILIPEKQDLRIVLIQRPTYDGAHSGQISFPGGKKEHTDSSLLETAIRECFEEIGVKLEPKDYLGQLTSVFIPVSQFDMEPHVFYLDQKPTFTPDHFEVDTIFSISALDLLQEESIQYVSLPTSKGVIMKNIPCFYLEEKVIWGATALVLNELKEILNNILA